MRKELALGMMRLPVGTDNKIDPEQTIRLVDCFLEHGFRKFDTAELYHDTQSEHAIREYVVKRYPRDSFEIADKLSTWRIPEGSSAEEFFQKQLNVTGLEYFDRYLLHSLDEKIYPDAEAKGYFDFIFEKKAQGLAREVGFSFHGKPELLDKVLTEYPEVDVVQLQINYIDWDNPAVRSRECYEIARKHGRKILIMEPVKGGLLANLPQDGAGILKSASPGASVASWAIRFAAGLKGVDTVLSGISTMEQMLDNVAVMNDFKQLSDDELKVLGQLRAYLNNNPRVECTGCGYCLAACPMNLPIPGFISMLNNVKMFGNMPQIVNSYKICSSRHRADECVNYGCCTDVCPQHLDIPYHLASLAKWAEKSGC
ncbi:MAG: Fe-S oxidoreductase [Lentisphaerae bacterium]|nr:Fe-S oxidoreductase [Lentisphaerota bacterium]